MAHEFACFGIPGPTIIRFPDLSDEFRDIVGVIARSHGVPLRGCIEYLEMRQYHRREYDGIHAVYLMVLLRLSDYLQIQASRAPAIVFKYRHIPSPQSQLEWEVHNSITKYYSNSQTIQNHLKYSANRRRS